MGSILLNNYSNLGEKIIRESGDPWSPIWLLVNPKYPNDIYDIWTPILYEIQDRVYRKLRARIDREKIFIMNAASNIGRVSNSPNCLSAEVSKEIVELRESVLEHQPKMLITFGTITNELVRRVFEMQSEDGPGYWKSANLEVEFERSITNFDITRTNWIPLIRRATKKGKNMMDGDVSEKYYHEVAAKIADRIIENKDSLNLWI